MESIFKRQKYLMEEVYKIFFSITSIHFDMK